MRTGCLSEAREAGGEGRGGEEVSGDSGSAGRRRPGRGLGQMLVFSIDGPPWY